MLGPGLDYLYLALYPTVIACALLMLAGGLSLAWQRLARALALLLALAGLADAVENASLVHLLRSGVVDGLATVAAVCASVKFAVLATALAMLVLLAVLRLLRRRKG